MERAASLVNGRPLCIVKLAKPKQDFRFDVPTIGLGTIETMVRCGVTAMAIEARKTLMLDRAELIGRANASNLAIEAVE
jgi:hypothetical protein